ncbi:hypothetical protein [Paraburkholderia caribensis]|uniref:hypothetical protein n=1 Tax=Paraburkholderia caribensis TaxID=75105 RepID=UPI0011B1FA0B|nr:hypothetical protein [Paraburkholderia caribensis]
MVDGTPPDGENVDDAANGSQTTTPANGGGEGEPNEGDEEGEFDFQFGEEAPPASEGQEEQNNAPQWVKDLRKQNVELNRRLREMEAKGKQQPQEPAVPTLGAKPKLEDFDYDEGKFDAALGQWYEDKRKVDAAAAEEQEAGRRRQEAIEARLNGYRGEAASLRRKDFQEIEGEVVTVLSVEQQGILLAGADKPATLVYALGRYPNKLRELAKIKDPVRFAFAAAKLEKELKVTTRTANKPAPEGRVSSSSGAAVTGSGEKKLEQLRAEAERTGDYSKVVAYKAQLKKAQQTRR